MLGEGEFGMEDDGITLEPWVYEHVERAWSTGSGVFDLRWLGRREREKKG